MVRPDSPDLIGDIKNRGDRTTWPPPPGQGVKEGTLQGGSVDYPSQPPAGRPVAGALIERRGDLSGTYPTLQPHDPYGGQRGRDQKASWEWLSFAASLPADFLPMPAGAAGGLVVSGRQVLVGGNFANSSTAAVTVTIRDGMDATGGFVQQVSVPATGLANLVLPLAGILIELGLFAVYSGAGITGSLYAVHLWKYKFTPPGE